MNLFILTLSLFLLPQTEIAKRLNAILAQIMPFLSQEVSFEAPGRSSLGMEMAPVTVSSYRIINLTDTKPTAIVLQKSMRPRRTENLVLTVRPDLETYCSLWVVLRLTIISEQQLSGPGLLFVIVPVN